MCVIYPFDIKGCIEDIVNHDVGCKIGLIKWNILAYADPSFKFIKLIDILGESIKKHLSEGKNLCKIKKIKNK